jgi:hypothetical protein
MGQTTDQIASGIDQTREALKSNLEELESRVKSAADWRSYFRKHPGSMVVTALIGGVLLSSMLGKRPPSRQD